MGPFHPHPPAGRRFPRRRLTVLASVLLVVPGLIGIAPVADATPPRPSSEEVVPVDVRPGASLQAVVDAHPVGTVFRIHGLHVGQSVRPKDGQRFIGAPGAVLRGSGPGPAFHGSADDVRIVGLEITGYETRPQAGAIDGGGDRWVVRRNTIHHNATVGVRLLGDAGRIVGNRIHHNGQLGISMHGRDGRVRNNEIAYNNWKVEFDWEWEAGGTKFWQTDGLVVRGNWSHHNHGPGLWSDKGSIRILYVGNLVEDNYAAGVFHEIGYRAVIRDNVIRRNGFGHAAWLWGAGIVIAASQNVKIRRNVIEANANGIGVLQQNRGTGAHGPYLVRNVKVRNNTIIDSGRTGAAQDTGNMAIFSSNVTFDRNTYVGAIVWEWEGVPMSWGSWRRFGHDLDGRYRPR